MRYRCLILALVLASAAGLPAAAQDFDPTLQIVPLDAEAQLIADGFAREAADQLEMRTVDALAHYGELDASSWPLEADDAEVWTRRVTASLNFVYARVLGCIAYSRLDSKPWPLEDCLRNVDLFANHMWCRAQDSACLNDPMGETSWTVPFRAIAEALVLEKEGDHAQALMRYGTSARQIANLVWTKEHYDGPPALDGAAVTPPSALIFDAVETRKVRLAFASSPKTVPGQGSFSSDFCIGHAPQDCPGAYLAYAGMVKLLTGQFGAASEDLTNAATRPQPWLGADIYNHPSVWRAVVAHRFDDTAGAMDGVAQARVLRNREAPEFDVVLSLLSYATPVPDEPPAACDTPGCLLVLAYLQYGEDHADAARLSVERGIKACGATVSMICKGLEIAQFKIDRGGSL
jgi:hypothetical protein